MRNTSVRRLFRGVFPTPAREQFMKKPLLTALAVLSVVACSDDSSDPTATGLAASFIPCAFGKGSELRVGETRTYTGAEASTLCLQAGSDGADYTLVPFLTTPDGEVRLSVEALGANVTPPVGPPDPTLLPGGAAAAAPRRDQAAHLRLMERMRAGLPARTRGAARRSLAPLVEAPQADVPAQGSLITINIPQFYTTQNPCAVSATRQARVAAVTERAILVNDPLNPPGGLTDAELLAFGQEFDRQIYPVDTQYFGTPVDLDANGGRVIIVFTREVNLLTPPNSGGGYVGGFFWAGDLFPRQSTPLLEACPRSNVGEIFYLLAPDATGAAGNVRPKDLILRSAAGTIAHEFQHLINAERRIFVNNADELEDAWLDEALAHSAEELNFYAASGLTPRRNLSIEQLTASDAVASAVDKYQLDNFGRYLSYLEAPDDNSVIGPDLLETRGGSWAFLRYAADRKNTGDQPFFFALVNNREIGVANMSKVLGAPALDWIQDWTMSVYTDDAVPGVDARFLQPSWNFRSVMPQVASIFGAGSKFPLKVQPLGSASASDYRLRGGGAAYLRFGIGAGARVGLRLTSDDEVPPSTLRFSLVRTR